MMFPRIAFFTHRLILSGLNLERFMNHLQKADIPLLSARRMDLRTLECECYSVDLSSIEQLVMEKGWRMVQKEPTQLSKTFHQLKQRPGIWMGALLAMIMISVLMQFVWRIDILNAGSYRTDIAQYLEAEGYHRGMQKASIDAEALQQKLTRRYPDLAWIQVYVYHMTMVIDVTKGVPMPDIFTAQTGDIVALQDGIVDNIWVFAGTAMVAPGDLVQKGQVLIQGAEHAADEQWTTIKARGQVMARCFHSEIVEMPLRNVESMETGKEGISHQIVTPWFCLPNTPETPDFLAYNNYIHITPIVGSFFPIYEQKMIHREVSMEYVLKNLQDVKKEAQEAALEALKFSLYGYELIDKWVDYCMIEDETLRATATAEWLMDIASEATP